MCLSLILHLEHNGIFDIFQVSSTKLLYTVQVGKKGEQGHICIGWFETMYRSVIKIHTQTPKKPQTKQN